MYCDFQAALDVAELFDAALFLQRTLDRLNVCLDLAKQHQIIHVNYDDAVLVA